MSETSSFTKDLARSAEKGANKSNATRSYHSPSKGVPKLLDVNINERNAEEYPALFT
jgi:hypothetical protein